MTDEHDLDFQPILSYSEVWPLGADEVSIWLLSGEAGPWPSDYIDRRSDAQTMAELECIRHSVNLATCVLHSSSWRTHYDEDTDQNFDIKTFMLADSLDDLALDRWPDARAFTPEFAESLGRAPHHGPAEPPIVRWGHVLLHGVRHLRYLRDTDSDIRDGLSDDWCRHLEAFEPAIAQMYR